MANTKLSDSELNTLSSISKGTTSFAFDLYNVLKTSPGNLFFSPLSVQLVLALAYSGAKSSTADEIAKALLLPKKLDDVLKGYGLLLNILDDPSLSVANRMFIEETFDLLTEFQEAAEKYFRADAGLVPYIKNSEGARQTINKWVEDKTNNKIKDLLSKGVLQPDTRLVLVNAIHFKADWTIKFDERNTKQKPFYVTKTETIDTAMMHMTKNLSFLHDEELKVKALKLSYGNSNLEMLILLPDEIDGLNELESNLSRINISERFRYFGRPKVEVQLPKFKLETTMQLKDVLKKLGLETMFSQDANFSGISSKMQLSVSDVIQKAFVEVNEKGTEAAAATAVVMGFGCAMPFAEPKIERFIANHPFLYIILRSASCYHSFASFSSSVVIPVFIGCYSFP